MLSAHVLVDIGGPSRAEIAGRTHETRILLALVTQMPRQGTAMRKATPAVVSTAELFARIRCLTAVTGQSTVFQRDRRKPNVARINACNKIPITDGVSFIVNQACTSICTIVISAETEQNYQNYTDNLKLAFHKRTY